MRWIEFSFKTSSEAGEVLAERLAQLGAAGIATEDPNEYKTIIAEDDDTVFVEPDFLERLGTVTGIRAYFACFPDGLAYHALEGPGIFSNIDTENLYRDGSFPRGRISVERFNKLLEDELAYIGQFLDTSPGEITYREVDPEEWQSKFKDHYRPMRLSKRLFVVPSWLEFKRPVGTQLISLDPGSAFGTGSHETTQMTAEFIDKYMKPGSKVLDLGTGSGILAIAAAKLGARSVRAIDISEQSVEVCRSNVEMNKVDDKVCSARGELKDDRSSYDIIAANLIAEILIDLAPEMPKHLNDLGLVICSGIIDHKLQGVLKAFKKAGMTVFDQNEKNDWHTVVFTR